MVTPFERKEKQELWKLYTTAFNLDISCHFEQPEKPLGPPFGLGWIEFHDSTKALWFESQEIIHHGLWAQPSCIHLHGDAFKKNHGGLTSWWSVPGLVNSFTFSRLSHWCGLFNHVFVSERRKQCTCNDWWMVWKLNEKKSKGSRVLSWWEKGEGRGFKTWMLEHVKETCFRMQPAWFLRERG